MYNILTLDQSSRTSGYAIFRDNQLYSYGTFPVDDSDLGTRLYKIRQKVSELIDDFDIDEVALEDIYLDRSHINNVSTFKILAEVFGVLEEYFTEIKMPYTAVLAGTWKSTCDVKGRTRPEQKKNAQNFVLKSYNVKAKQDACDAICIGTHIIKKNNSEINWE